VLCGGRCSATCSGWRPSRGRRADPRHSRAPPNATSTQPTRQRQSADPAVVGGTPRKGLRPLPGATISGCLCPAQTPTGSPTNFASIGGGGPNWTAAGTWPTLVASRVTVIRPDELAPPPGRRSARAVSRHGLPAGRKGRAGPAPARDPASSRLNDRPQPWFVSALRRPGFCPIWTHRSVLHAGP